MLDKRILRLETDLATIGRQISSAPTELIAGTTSENQPSGDQFDEGVMVGGFSVACLERRFVGMDAIAIEIERISEGQRFVTRLLSETRLQVEASNDR